MRVAFITHSTGLYGANKSLLDMIDGLRPHGVEPFVVATDHGELNYGLHKRGVPLAVIPFELWVSRHWDKRKVLWRLLQNRRMISPLLRQLREWNIDLLHTNSSVIPIGAMASRWMHRPHIWHLREFPDLDYAMQHDLGAATFRHVIANADAQIAVSHAVRKHIVPHSSRAHVIYDGVASAAEFDQLWGRSHAAPRAPGPYTFLMVGMIYPVVKGQDVALRAMRLVVDKLPDARLLFVGSGWPEHVAECKALTVELGLSRNVEFLGHRSDPFDAFLAADSVLMCSRNEGMGRVTVEAHACCRPVIGYDAGGTSELVEHEKTGLLRRGGPPDLAAEMMRVIQKPDWARKLGEQGWLRAKANHSIEVQARRTFDVMKELVDRSPDGNGSAARQS